MIKSVLVASYVCLSWDASWFSTTYYRLVVCASKVHSHRDGSVTSCTMLRSLSTNAWPHPYIEVLPKDRPDITYNHD